MPIIPISVKTDEITPSTSFEELTFKDLNLSERHIEEFVRKHIGSLFGEEESLLIVGQQTTDREGSRSDLVALDGDGSLVLIEIKRDLADIRSRAEALESQAVRYAASLAKLKTPQDIVSKLFAAYIERHRNEEPFKEHLDSLSSNELASREVSSFLKQNGVSSGLNENQRIFLIASEFDPLTLSGTAWLIKNGVDISCYQLTPCQINSELCLKFERILPNRRDEEHFVDIRDKTKPIISTSASRRARTLLPRMPQLFEWGILGPGDKVSIKNFPGSDATVVSPKTVSFQDEEMSFNAWGLKVTSWSSICIYDWAVLNRVGKTLTELRQEKMESEGLAANNAA